MLGEWIGRLDRMEREDRQELWTVSNHVVT